MELATAGPVSHCLRSTSVPSRNRIQVMRSFRKLASTIALANPLLGSREMGAIGRGPSTFRSRELDDACPRT